MMGVGLSFFFLFFLHPLSDLLCLRSSRSNYNASAIDYLLVCFFPHFDRKYKNDMLQRKLHKKDHSDRPLSSFMCESVEFL